MNDVASIRIGGGTLVMPARTLYERELLFEQAEFYGRRDGRVRLELDRRQTLIGMVRGAATEPCGECGRSRGVLSFSVDGRSLCRHCVRTYEG
jgi:ribosomal protein S14